jgi:hypothetical protein
MDDFSDNWGRNQQVAQLLDRLVVLVVVTIQQALLQKYIII